MSLNRLIKTCLPPCLLLAAASACAAPPLWAEDLLGLTGTATVFDAQSVRQAMSATDVQPDLELLAQSAGYRPWPGARLWLLEQTAAQKLTIYKADAAFRREMDRRGLIIETRVPEAWTATLPDLLRAKDRKPLARFLSENQLDGVLILTPGTGLRWQLALRDFTLTGALDSAGRLFLPHVWAENLALQWQWPALGQAALVEVTGINGFTAFKTAETALGTVCQSVRLLRIKGPDVAFACQAGASARVPEKTGSLPLSPLPLADHGLDDMVLMGRQLSARSGVWLWRPEQALTP